MQDMGGQKLPQHPMESFCCQRILLVAMPRVMEARRVVGPPGTMAALWKARLARHLAGVQQKLASWPQLVGGMVTGIPPG